MKKVLIIIVVLLVFLPFLPRILPKRLTIDRIQQGLQAAGYQVAEFKEVTAPQLEADSQWSMAVNGARTNVYLYTDVGVIAKNHEYQKKDVGTAIVETWNLQESLGAAPDRNIPTYVARKGMFLIIVATPDQALGAALTQAFKKL